MLRTLGVALLALGLIAGAAGWLLSGPNRLTADALPAHSADLANGERMFFAGGCASCHAAPGATGEARLVLSGGLALDSPYGTFHAPNISPGPQGIGGWSDLDFANAMLRGVAPEGFHYYPAFPYTSYQRMRLGDVLDLKAYLDTLPVDDTLSRGHDLRFPYTIRRSLGLWKRLYLDEEPFVADPAWDEQTALGAYLVEGPGHCQECHTPRDSLGGRIDDRAFAGAANLEGEGFNPNITPHPDGIASWTAGDLAYMLESGFTPEFDSVGGAMGAVVSNFSRLEAADREAVAAYLLSLPALPTQR
jgi:mono/diheme cytochrome c family protein